MSMRRLTVLAVIWSALGVSGLEAQQDCVRNIFNRCISTPLPSSPARDTATVLTRTVQDTAAIRAARQAAIDSMNAIMRAQAQATTTTRAVQPTATAPSRTTTRSASTASRASQNEQQICQLGTQYAVNRSRQAQPDERRFVTDKPYRVRINQRESPGSSRIVWRDCELPAGTAVWSSNGGVWVEVCGNDVLGIPLPLLAGPAGRDGLDGRNGLDGSNGRDLRILTQSGRPWWHYAVGAAVLGGTGWAIYECATDWCKGEDRDVDNSNEVDVTVRLFRAGLQVGPGGISFSLPVP